MTEILSQEIENKRAKARLHYRTFCERRAAGIKTRPWKRKKRDVCRTFTKEERIEATKMVSRWFADVKSVFKCNRRCPGNRKSSYEALGKIFSGVQ